MGFWQRDGSYGMDWRGFLGLDSTDGDFGRERG